MSLREDIEYYRQQIVTWKVVAEKSLRIADEATNRLFVLLDDLEKLTNDAAQLRVIRGGKDNDNA